jgi:fructose-bisphosphate aldolase class II
VTLAQTADLIASAVARASAVPSFNVITLEHAEAIVEGAERARVDVLLQVSRNAIAFHGGLIPLASACRALANEARVGVGIHLDHIDDLTLAEEAIGQAVLLGVSSIMIDASQLPDAENMAVTRRLRDRAKMKSLWVEAELGEIGGKDGAHVPGVRTDPADAREFVRTTAIDGLAVAVGSSHAMTERTAALDIDLIARLASAVPVPLVLHGSSGVPDRIIVDAVNAGIRKVNIGTALNVAYSGAIRRSLASDSSSTDPRRSLRFARDAMADAVAELASVVASVSLP